ncbi:MAG: Ankyrin-2 [Icmadophila ericetorum]|nr:Ankyrin-2 [Icmadophila ericetorum]
MTALFAAVARRDIELAKFLLDEGADIEHPPKFGATPLLVAVNYNHHEAIRLLLERGANPHMVTKSNISILHLAAQTGDLKTLKILLSANLTKLQINPKDRSGMSPNDLADRRMDLPPEWYDAQLFYR